MITLTTFMPYKREEGMPSLEVGHETMRQLGLRLQDCPQTSSQEGGGFGERERADPLTYYHQFPAGRLTSGLGLNLSTNLGLLHPLFLPGTTMPFESQTWTNNSIALKEMFGI